MISIGFSTFPRTRPDKVPVQFCLDNVGKRARPQLKAGLPLYKKIMEKLTMRVMKRIG